MALPASTKLAMLAAALLLCGALLPAVRAGGSVGCVNDDEGADDDAGCPEGCATGEVVIPDGQRCGGDRNGCCQSTNIGSKQNQYPSCRNPNPAKEPKYCKTSIKNSGLWTPWNCDDFRCNSGSLCVCNTGDCTCTSQQNFNNIKNNGKGYSTAACGTTLFGAYARNHGIDGGDYACQKK